VWHTSWPPCIIKVHMGIQVQLIHAHYNPISSTPLRLIPHTYHFILNMLLFFFSPSPTPFPFAPSSLSLSLSLSFFPFRPKLRIDPESLESLLLVTVNSDIRLVIPLNDLFCWIGGG
jgi:hypothetical protein